MGIGASGAAHFCAGGPCPKEVEQKADRCPPSSWQQRSDNLLNEHNDHTVGCGVFRAGVLTALHLGWLPRPKGAVSPQQTARSIEIVNLWDRSFSIYARVAIRVGSSRTGESLP